MRNDAARGMTVLSEGWSNMSENSSSEVLEKELDSCQGDCNLKKTLPDQRT